MFFCGVALLSKEDKGIYLPLLHVFEKVEVSVSSSLKL